jgi:hypothetical protein
MKIFVQSVQNGQKRRANRFCPGSIAIVIFRASAKTKFNNIKEDPMPKDSQIDKKQVRLKKANFQTPLSRENQNQNRNAKKHSIPNSDV